MLPEHAPVEKSEENPGQGESGNAQASVEGESLTEGASQTKGEPTVVEGLFDGMTAEQLHKSYKSLQGEYSTTKDSVKDFQEKLSQFDRFGGVEQVTNYLDTLIQNPRFHEFVKAEQAANMLGVQPGDIDEDTQRALEVVRTQAEQIAEQRIREELERDVLPIVNQYKEAQLEANFAKMDETYGEGWRDLRSEMEQLAVNLPEKVQDNPTFEDISGLYMVALNKSGKMTEYAKRLYEAELEKAKLQSTNKPSPGSAGTGAKSPAKSFGEAAQRAMEQLGLTDADLR